MIRHTKLVLLLSIIVIVFACKKGQNNNLKLPTKSNVIFSGTKSNSNANNTYQYFTSYKINNNYTTSDKNITDKFRNLTFNFTNDTIVKVKGKGQESLYRNVILAKKYFGHKYLYRFYSNFLHDKLNIDLPKNIETVRNKNSHLKQSILYDLFKEGFFIKENFIFEYDGNIIIFQKSNNTKILNLEKTSNKLPYNKTIDIKNIKYSNYQKKLVNVDDWLCGKKSLRYLPITIKDNIELILVPKDCGDFNYRFFLLSIFENKIVSSLYVEGKWSEPGDDEYEEKTSFKISLDYKIKISTKEIENRNVVKTRTENYSINEKGVFVKGK